MKPLSARKLRFAGSRSRCLGGRRGAASAAARRDSCPCNPKRLPPRARARRQRRRGQLATVRTAPTNRLAARTVALPVAALATMAASPEARWTEVRLIGRGAQGSVHLVRHNSTQQLCVRKRVATENLSKRDRDAAHRECQLLKTLDHPRIVKFVESFEGRLEDDARCLHLVMEWCPQGDLAYHINEAKYQQKIQRTADRPMVRADG